MIRDIVTHPDKRINIISPDLRAFDDDLLSVIEDLKDTITAHNTDALAAIQIAIPFSLIVIKEEDGSFTEIINPRIIGKKGSIISNEQTLYFPNTTHSVNRYEEIKLIYQDKEAKQQSLDVKGERAILLQRKIDYVFGATIANKIEQQGGKLSDSLPASCDTSTIFKRDYFISFIQKILFFIILANITSFFLSNETLTSLYAFTKYGSIAIVLLLIGYFFTALYESKNQNSCSSCQMGNIIGTTIKYFLTTTALFILSWYLLKI